MNARVPLAIELPTWDEPVAREAPVVGLVIGELAAIVGSPPMPIVRWRDAGGVRISPARSTVELAPESVGGALALMFENADTSRPVVVGLLYSAPSAVDRGRGRIDIDVDGERLVVEARQRLELRCGAARISLDCDGTVAIHGTQIISHAEGVNRIRGGSIHLN